MSTSQYDTFEKLKVGSDDHKIKARVIRFWRGSTRAGEVFKNFNLILLDHKGQRMHAFVPTKCAEEVENHISVGRVFAMKNFEVQAYKPTDKYRFLRTDRQIVLNKDTKIQEVADDGVTIPQDAFDFYDHSQLEELTKQTTYLADVIGIIKTDDKLRDLRNRHGIDQKQAKFIITDGSSNVNVTFWDKFGEHFISSMKKVTEKPVIIIISGCKVGKWNGEVDISNSFATKIYLNYKHHSVLHLRKLLANEEFAKQAMGIKKEKTMERITVEMVNKLGKNAIEGFFMLHVKIKGIDESMKWFFNVCTNCDKETKMQKPCPICESCNRYVPHPDIKFRIHVVAEDLTGQIQVILGDREVRTLIGRRAREFVEENTTMHPLPKALLSILHQDYTVVIQIKEINIVNSFKVYWGTDICKGFVTLPNETSPNVSNNEANTSHATTSTYNAHGISDINLSSTMEI